MKSFFAAAFAAIASANKVMDVREYLKYVAKFGKDYQTMEEFVERAKIFLMTDKVVNAHNAMNASYTLGHNQFSDLTEEEKAEHLGAFYVDAYALRAPERNEPVANAMDWRDAGCVSPVKNQGQCGSCWSFATTGAVEGAHCSKTGELISFSEQQLVDCSTDFNMGCNGGNPYYAYDYLQDHYAIREEDYAYRAVQGDCAYDSSPKTDVMVDQVYTVDANSPDALKAALNTSTVAVLIEADQLQFQLYSEGIFDNVACGTNLDHGVMLVGYGEENGQEYYVLKNSWDTTWGESGFMRIAIVDGEGICGVQMGPTYVSTTA